MALYGAQPASLEAAITLIKAAQHAIVPLQLEELESLLQDCILILQSADLGLHDESTDVPSSQLLQSLLAFSNHAHGLEDGDQAWTTHSTVRPRAMSWSSGSFSQETSHPGRMTLLLQSTILSKLRQELDIVRRGMRNQVPPITPYNASSIERELLMAGVKTLIAIVDRHTDFLVRPVERRASDTTVFATNRRPAQETYIKALHTLSERTQTQTRVTSTVAATVDSDSPRLDLEFEHPDSEPNMDGLPMSDRQRTIQEWLLEFGVVRCPCEISPLFTDWCYRTYAGSVVRFPRATHHDRVLPDASDPCFYFSSLVQHLCQRLHLSCNLFLAVDLDQSILLGLSTWHAGLVSYPCTNGTAQLPRSRRGSTTMLNYLSNVFANNILPKLLTISEA